MRADEIDPVVHPEKLGAIAHHDGDAFAGFYAEREQTIGRTLRMGQDLGIGEAAVLPLEPNFLRLLGRVLANRLFEAALSSTQGCHPFQSTTHACARSDS